MPTRTRCASSTWKKPRCRPSSTPSWSPPRPPVRCRSTTRPGSTACRKATSPRPRRMRAARKLDGKWLLALQNTTQQPVLASLKDRELRAKVLEASETRTEHGDANDTRKIIQRLAQLRAQKAKLLGFDTYAAYSLADQMAISPDKALKLLTDTVPAATAKARGEIGQDAGGDRRAEGRLQARRLGLGFLRRAGAQGRVRPRRIADQAVLRDGQRAAQRRVLRGQRRCTASPSRNARTSRPTTRT